MTDTRCFAGTVHHVSFRVTNLAASLEFYEGVLGCRRIERPDEKLSTPGAWLQAGATQVHLIEAPANELTGFPPSSLTPNANHVAFHSDDIEAAHQVFQERGVEVRRGKVLPQFFVADPDGNVIEFTAF